MFVFLLTFHSVWQSLGPSMSLHGTISFFIFPIVYMCHIFTIHSSHRHREELWGYLEGKERGDELRGQNWHIYITVGFPGAAVLKNLHAHAGDTGFNPWFRKIPWSKKWQPTLVFLAGKSHRQKSPTDSRVTESWTWLSNWTHTHTNTHSTMHKIDN